jgi:hypothetical protein
VGIQDVKWEKRATEPTSDSHSSTEMECLSFYRGTGFSAHKTTTAAVSRAEGVSDRMSHSLRGCWCDIIVLNATAPTEDKYDDKSGSFYEELEQAFDPFPT